MVEDGTTGILHINLEDQGGRCRRRREVEVVKLVDIDCLPRYHLRLINPRQDQCKELDEVQEEEDVYRNREDAHDFS